MSNYRAPAYHPTKRCVEEATWIDNHFGSHVYGIRFDGNEHVYRPHEVGLEAAAAALRALRAALETLTSAVEHMRVPQTANDAALQVMVALGPAVTNARAVLAAAPPPPSRGEDTADAMGRDSMVRHILNPIRGYAADERYQEAHRRCNEALRLAGEAIRAAATPAPPWQLVPKEPTQEMIHAAQHSWLHDQGPRAGSLYGSEVADLYRAMLAAVVDDKREGARK